MQLTRLTISDDGDDGSTFESRQTYKLHYTCFALSLSLFLSLSLSLSTFLTVSHKGDHALCFVSQTHVQRRGSLSRGGEKIFNDEGCARFRKKNAFSLSLSLSPSPSPSLFVRACILSGRDREKERQTDRQIDR